MNRVFASKSKIKCKFCELEVRQDRMTIHEQSYHKDKLKEKKERERSTLAQFFMPKKIPPKTQTITKTVTEDQRQLSVLNELIGEVHNVLQENKQQTQNTENRILSATSTTTEHQSRKENMVESSAAIFEEFDQIRKQILENEDQSQAELKENIAPDQEQLGESYVPEAIEEIHDVLQKNKQQTENTENRILSTMSTTNEHQSRIENMEEFNQIRRQILENEDQSQASASKNANHHLSAATSIHEEIEIVQEEQGNKNLEREMDIDDNNTLFENSMNFSASTSKLNAKTPILNRYHKFCNSIFKRRKISGDTTVSSRATTSFDSNTKSKSKLDSLISNVVEMKKEVVKISNQMDKLKMSGNLMEETISSKENSFQASLNAKKTLVQSSKSLSEILRYNEYLVALASEDAVSCQICDSSDGGKSVGRFHYDYSLGTDFNDRNSPREFLNLKGNIVRHMSTNVHIKNAKENELTSKQKTLFKARNYKVGIALGRQAYHILKASGSHSEYENDVSVLSAQGTDVGQLNHSRKFVAEFAKSVHQVLVTQMQKLVNEPLAATGKPTPFAVLADKLTPNRRTMQIVGFHGFVNGKFQSLMSGVPPLSGEDGLVVTKTLKSGLTSLNIPDNELSPV